MHVLCEVECLWISAPLSTVGWAFIVCMRGGRCATAWLPDVPSRCSVPYVCHKHAACLERRTCLWLCWVLVSVSQMAVRVSPCWRCLRTASPCHSPPSSQVSAGWVRLNNDTLQPVYCAGGLGGGGGLGVSPERKPRAPLQSENSIIPVTLKDNSATTVYSFLSLFCHTDIDFVQTFQLSKPSVG